MKCTLMHGRIAVADIEVDNVDGFIKKINMVYAPEHLPVGIPIHKNGVDRKELNNWWTERSIPAERSGIREALEVLGVPDTKILPVRCLGLSLSDNYWIRPECSAITWDEINFFENTFSDDVGDALFGEIEEKDVFDLNSPDNTTDGNLKKRWKIIDGKCRLVKGGSNPFCQQPFNEVIAAGIMERLGIPHIEYKVIWDKGEPYSVCEDFVTKDTELVPAWRIIQTQKKDNRTSMYGHFVNCCNALGIKDVIPFLDRMITVDYIIANEDRHLNNFGVLRNAEKAEWLGFAPIYDSGTSLGYDKAAGQIRTEHGVICKPFKKYHVEQLKLVSSFDWIDFERLADVRELIIETLSAENAGNYMDENRIRAIAYSVENRIRRLSRLAMEHTRARNISVENDVEENIAERY